MEQATLSKAELAHLEWVQGRRMYLGGTDVAAILGEHPRKTALQVWRDKKGLVSDFDNPKMRFGREREAYVIRRYMEMSGNKVRRCGPRLMKGTPHFGANPDGLILLQRAVLECKTGINRPGTRYEWGKPGTDEVPRHYLIQGVWYCAVLELPYVVFAFEDRETCEVNLYFVYRDKEYEHMFLPFSDRWWREHMLADVEPLPVEGDLADIKAEFPKDAGRVMRATEEIEEIVYRLIRAKAVAGKLYAKLKTDEARVQQFMGDASALLGTWGKPITWKNDRDSWKTDFDKAICEFKFLAAAQLGDVNHPVLKLLEKTLTDNRFLDPGDRKFLVPKVAAISEGVAA